MFFIALLLILIGVGIAFFAIILALKPNTSTLQYRIWSTIAIIGLLLFVVGIGLQLGVYLSRCPAPGAVQPTSFSIEEVVHR